MGRAGLIRASLVLLFCALLVQAAPLAASSDVSTESDDGETGHAAFNNWAIWYKVRAPSLSHSCFLLQLLISFTCQRDDVKEASSDSATGHGAFNNWAIWYKVSLSYVFRIPFVPRADHFTTASET
jgi:hypothetical protein